MRIFRSPLFLAVAVVCGSAFIAVATSAHPKIARMWRGYVATQNADAYARYLEERGVKKLASIPGNRGVEMWRRDDGDRTEFVVVSYWDSKEGIQHFTGPEWEKVKPLPDDAKYLVGPAASVTHYEIVSEGAAR